jgi:hypothetical protein
LQARFARKYCHALYYARSATYKAAILRRRPIKLLTMLTLLQLQHYSKQCFEKLYILAGEDTQIFEDSEQVFCDKWPFPSSDVDMGDP